MHVQLFGGSQIATNCRYQPETVELLSSDRVQVRGEDVDGLDHGLRRPLVRSGHLHHLLPRLKIRNYFESFGDFATAITSEDFAYLAVDSFDLGVIK